MALGKLAEALVGLAAIGAVLLIVLARLLKKTPKLGEWLSQYNPTNLYEKVDVVPEVKEKMEQVYERRMI